MMTIWIDPGICMISRIKKILMYFLPRSFARELAMRVTRILLQSKSFLSGRLYRYYQKPLLSSLPDTDKVLKVGRRSTSIWGTYNGTSEYRKIFNSNELSLECLQNELKARETFGDEPWMIPILNSGNDFITLPYLSSEARLDNLARMLPQQTKFMFAGDALAIAFRIFCAGYAHRDLSARNFFFHEGQLLLGDYEWLEMYPPGELPPFPESYDLLGQGLKAPGKTSGMCYDADHPSSLKHVLGVSLTEALDIFTEQLKGELLAASKTFQRHNARHICQAGRIYGSFSLPYFEIPTSEAQRNTSQRLTDFGIQADMICGKKMLDLGSNVGALCFELQQFCPGLTYGIEVDMEKVTISTKIARFCGLRNLEFRQGNVDVLTPQDIPGPFDLVFCLALEEHIRDRERLYRFLAEITSGTLYFEGNGNTKPTKIEKCLQSVGFKEIRFAGICSDDCRKANNQRPLFIASR